MSSSRQLLAPYLDNGGGSGTAAADQFVLLAGPAGCGKTSLLFQMGLNTCRAGGRVLFLCASEARMKRRCPLAQRAAVSTSSGKQPTQRQQQRPWRSFEDAAGRFAADLQHMHLRYLDAGAAEGESRAGLLARYLCHLHALERQPDMIIVDDMSEICGTPKEKCRVLALLEQARAHAMSVHAFAAGTTAAGTTAADRPQHRTCAVVVSDTLDDQHQVPDLEAYRRHVRSTWWVLPSTQVPQNQMATTTVAAAAVCSATFECRVQHHRDAAPADPCTFQFAISTDETPPAICIHPPTP